MSVGTWVEVREQLQWWKSTVEIIMSCHLYICLYLSKSLHVRNFKLWDFYLSAWIWVCDWFFIRKLWGLYFFKNASISLELISNEIPFALRQFCKVIFIYFHTSIQFIKYFGFGVRSSNTGHNRYSSSLSAYGWFISTVHFAYALMRNLFEGVKGRWLFLFNSWDCCALLFYGFASA